MAKRSPQGRYIFHTVGRLLSMPANKNINLYHVTKLSLNTSRWLFIIYLHKGSYACFIHKNHFGPLLSDYFFIWEIVDLNLTSRVRSLVNVTPNLSIKANWSFLKTTFTAFCYIPGQKLLKRKKTHRYNQKLPRISSEDCHRWARLSWTEYVAITNHLNSVGLKILWKHRFPGVSVNRGVGAAVGVYILKRALLGLGLTLTLNTVKTRIQEHPFSGFRLIGFLYIGYFRWNQPESVLKCS